ncbi:GlxA family transcriptional regulator [Rhizorhabdus dicambivorans]|nr:helix-turn-helix domain-containing protein [Rhizorhabdus dicambivorans]
MLALAGFIDTLRLAADEGDRSRQIRCQWSVLSEGRKLVKASNGIVVQPNDGLIDPQTFDYVVVIGGTLHGTEQETETLLAYLRAAAAAGIPLIGLCNGVFTLARAGLMQGRRACVSWFHHVDYSAEFPDLPLVSDRMFLVDGNRITCPGGVGSVHLASWLVERHLGPGSAAKGLRIMLEEAAIPAEAPQPAPAVHGFAQARDPRVRRSLLAIERLLDQRLSLADIASMVGSTPRNLTRLFVADLGMTPKAAQEVIRMGRVRRLLSDTQWPIAHIAAECGFTDASHLIKRFRDFEGVTPVRYRDQRSSGVGENGAD